MWSIDIWDKALYLRRLQLHRNPNMLWNGRLKEALDIKMSQENVSAAR